MVVWYFFWLFCVIGVCHSEEIKHDLPEGLEIVDPKSLGLKTDDLDKLLGNVKLVPIASGKHGDTKTQILTVGFDGNEKLNLDDFELPTNLNLPEKDQEIAQNAFKQFQEYIQSKGSNDEDSKFTPNTFGVPTQKTNHNLRNSEENRGTRQQYNVQNNANEHKPNGQNIPVQYQNDNQQHQFNRPQINHQEQLQHDLKKNLRPQNPNNKNQEKIATQHRQIESQNPHPQQHQHQQKYVNHSTQTQTHQLQQVNPPAHHNQFHNIHTHHLPQTQTQQQQHQMVVFHSNPNQYINYQVNHQPPPFHQQQQQQQQNKNHLPQHSNIPPIKHQHPKLPYQIHPPAPAQHVPPHNIQTHPPTKESHPHHQISMTKLVPAYERTSTEVYGARLKNRNIESFSGNFNPPKELMRNFIPNQHAVTTKRPFVEVTPSMQMIPLSTNENAIRNFSRIHYYENYHKQTNIRQSSNIGYVNGNIPEPQNNFRVGVETREKIVHHRQPQPLNNPNHHHLPAPNDKPAFFRFPTPTAQQNQNGHKIQNNLKQINLEYGQRENPTFNNPEIPRNSENIGQQSVQIPQVQYPPPASHPHHVPFMGRNSNNMVVSSSETVPILNNDQNYQQQYIPNNNNNNNRQQPAPFRNRPEGYGKGLINRFRRLFHI